MYFLQESLCHIYRWVLISLLQFLKINTYARTWFLFVLSTTPMTWHALSCSKSECVVKSYNVLSHFMLTHMHFTMYCQLRQRFMIHAYFILVVPINFFLHVRQVYLKDHCPLPHVALLCSSNCYPQAK